MSETTTKVALTPAGYWSSYDILIVLFLHYDVKDLRMNEKSFTLVEELDEMTTLLGWRSIIFLLKWRMVDKDSKVVVAGWGVWRGPAIRWWWHKSLLVSEFAERVITNIIYDQRIGLLAYGTQPLCDHLFKRRSTLFANVTLLNSFVVLFV